MSDGAWATWETTMQRRDLAEPSTGEPAAAAPKRAPDPRQGTLRRRPGDGPLRLGRITLLLIGLACLLLTVTPGGRAATRAALLLPALIGASEPAPLLIAGDPVRHTQTVISSADGPVYLDIYTPTTPTPLIPGAREGLLLIPGVGDNRGVPQLVNLADSLARSGVVAMAMTTNSLINYTLAPETVDAVVQATRALQAYPSVGHGRVGIVGFSAGGSLGVLAAADPRLRGALAFVTSFGGYYDARALLRDLGRRALRTNGRLVPWQPDPVPIQTLASTLAQALSSQDSAILRSGFNTLNGLSLSPADQAQLSPPALAAYHLLVGDQPNRVAANLATLEPVAGPLLSRLSPSAAIEAIATSGAPVYLLHDQSDRYVPFTESRDFAAALTARRAPHQFVAFTIFAHVEVRSGLGVGQEVHDGWALYRVLMAVLAPST